MKIENLETMENISEVVSVTSSPFPLERDTSYQSDIHPYPTFEQLCEAGFRSEVAFSISKEYRHPFSNDHHPYTKRELFHVLYESDDPVKAYNEMMEEKMKKKMDSFNENFNEFVEKFGKYF